MKLLLTTVRGFEDYAAKEVEEVFGLKTTNKMFGKIFAEGNEEDVVKLNYGARSIHKIFELLYVGEIRSLEDIRKAFAEIDWQEVIARDSTFGIEAKRVGTHSFSSRDVAVVGGDEILKQLRGKGVRVYLDDPDYKIYAEVNRKLLIIGIDTTGKSLHARGYRKYQHPAPIKPTLAYLLLRFADVKKEKILDTFCGSGTIGIEYALWLKNVPKKWRSFRFERLPKYRGILEKIKDKWVEKELGDEIIGFGIDLYEKHVRGARENAESAGVLRHLVFRRGDATDTDVLKSFDVDLIVTNPPYGQRIGRKYVIEAMYLEYFRAARDAGYDRVVAVTGEPFFVKAAEKAGFELVKKKSIMYGALPAIVVDLRR